MITSYSRGHLIYFDNGVWKYVDNGLIIDENRPCARCGKSPTKEGHDHCLGNIENCISACCGHGVEEGYVICKGERK